MLEFGIAMVLRTGIGLLFGLLFGIGGLIFLFWVTPQIWVPPTWLIVISVGVSSSIAGFLAFYKPESTWKIVAIAFLLAFAGGMVGAWIGAFYAEVFYPEGVRNVLLVARSTRSPAIMPYITFAALFSTLLGAVYYGFRLWRYHEA